MKIKCLSPYRATILARDILRLLKASGMFLLDFSMIKLNDDVQRHFPDTRSKVEIKWYACFDLFSGQLKWFKLTHSKAHNRKCFSSVEQIKGKFNFFDLGYFDYRLLFELIEADAFFCAD